MKDKTIIILVHFIFSIGFCHSISAQTECYSFASNIYYNDISVLIEILEKGQIKKIVEKRGIIKNIYEFDSLQKSITIKEKYFQINASIDKIWINDSLIEKRTYKWLRKEKSESTIDYFYNRYADTMFTYNVFASDTILIAKSLYDNKSGEKVIYKYMLGPTGEYNEFYTVKSNYDKNHNKIKETIRDTTYSNNGFLSFEGKYNDLGNIVFEKCSTSYNNQAFTNVTLDYKYRLNKYEDWIRKYCQRTDKDENYKIKRRIRYY
ncbi:MAG: hypothetical protein HQ521_10410 [Bacteroidetes bacterium]|nr:hypothetical protein [Bacteroidota bacterium]